MDNNINLGITGAKRQTWADSNPRNLLIQLREEYGTDDAAFLEEEFIKQVLTDPLMTRVCLSYWYVNNSLALKKAEEAVRTTAPRKQAREQHKAVQTLVAETVKAKVETKVQEQAKRLLLDLILPDGTVLRHATFAQAGRAGGWFRKLEALGKPRQIIGKVLTEEDVSKIR